MAAIHYEGDVPGWIEDLRPASAIQEEQRLIMERLRTLQMEWEHRSHDLWTRYLMNKSQLTLLGLKQAPTSRPLTDREMGRMRVVGGGE